MFDTVICPKQDKEFGVSDNSVPLPNDTVSNPQSAKKTGSVWESVLRSLTHQLESSQADKWVAELRPLAEFEDKVYVAARDQLGYFRIRGRIERIIQRRWEALDPKKRGLVILAWDDVPAPVRELIDNPWHAGEPSNVTLHSSSHSTSSQAKNQAHSLTFHTLIEGEANRRAIGLAKRLAGNADIGGSVAYFHGRQGTGKTHILRSIVDQIETEKTMRVVYCSAEDFLTGYVEGARAGDTRAIRAKLRNVDILLLDDVHTLSGKKGTDQELLSTLKAITQTGGKVVISADVCARDLEGFSDRLLSEFRGAVAVEIQKPDQAMRYAILRQREAVVHQSCPAFILDDEMANMILAGIGGTGRDIIGILGSIFTETGFGDVPVTTDVVSKVIERYKGTRPQPTIMAIKNAVMRHFEISRTELEGASKARHHVYPRHVAMYLCRVLTGKSFPQIAFHFGKRDHTTVLSAFRKITKRLSKDHQLKSDLDTLTHTLES